MSTTDKDAAFDKALGQLVVAGVQFEMRRSQIVSDCIDDAIERMQTAPAQATSYYTQYKPSA